tara:strand:+ start:12393 stop:12902 length:510 start_codon:yes stop_codon:yes gene_type:complete
MGFNLFKFIGQKVKDGAQGLARLGKKVLGKAEHLGKKIAKGLGTGLNFVEKIPGLGAFLAPITKPLTRVLGVVEKGTELAGRGRAGIEKAEGLVRSGKEALKSGDFGGVMTAGRGLREIGRGGVSGVKEARRMGVGFGTGTRDAVIGAKGVGKSLSSAGRRAVSSIRGL